MKRAVLTFLGSVVIFLFLASLWIACWGLPYNYSTLSAGWCTPYPTIIGAEVIENPMPRQPLLLLVWIPHYATHQKFIFNRFGVHLYVRSDVRGAFWWMLFVQFWIPQLASLLLMLAALRPVLHHRRLIRQWGDFLCAHCGYDLRATPNRCPECGTIPKSDI
jgi:hypothetical protein